MDRRHFLSLVAGAAGVSMLPVATRASARLNHRRASGAYRQRDPAEAANYILDHARAGDPWMVVSPNHDMASYTQALLWEIAIQRQRAIVKKWNRGSVAAITIRTLDGGEALIAFRSGQHPDKLRGHNIAGLWIDEASMISEAALWVAIPCLRWKGQTGPIIFTTRSHV